MKIEVFESGCAKCKRTENNIRGVVQGLGLSAEVTHVTDINEILKRGVMITPAVFIDGKSVMEGRVPTVKVIEKWLKQV